MGILLITFSALRTISRDLLHYTLEMSAVIDVRTCTHAQSNARIGIQRLP
jgi:hypothetical protein